MAEVADQKLGQCCPPRDIWCYLETFLAVLTSEGLGAAILCWIEAANAAKFLVVH